MKAFFFILLTLSLFSHEITFYKIEEKAFTPLGLNYIIKANKKTIDSQQIKKANIFNIKSIVSKMLYYTQGVFYKNNIEIYFNKAYFYEGDFYMYECEVMGANIYIRAKEGIYKKKYIEFKNLVLEKNNKTYHKIKYIIKL